MTEQELFEYIWVPAIGYLMGLFSNISQINPTARDIYAALLQNGDPVKLKQAGARIKNILTQADKGSLLVDLTGIKNSRTLEDDIELLSYCVPNKPNSTLLSIDIDTSSHSYHLYTNTWTSADKFIRHAFKKSGNYIILDEICATKFEAEALLQVYIGAYKLCDADAIKLSNGKTINSLADLPDDLFDNTGLLNKSALNTTSKQQSTANTQAKIGGNKWKQYGSLVNEVKTFANNGTKEDLTYQNIAFIAIKPANGTKASRSTNRLNIRPLTTSGVASSTPKKLYLNSARDYNCFTCFVLYDTAHKAELEKLLNFCAKKFNVARSDLGLYYVRSKTNGYFAVTTEAGVDVYIEAKNLNEALKRANTLENTSFVESITDSNDTDWIDYVQKTMD